MRRHGVLRNCKRLGDFTGGKPVGLAFDKETKHLEPSRLRKRGECENGSFGFHISRLIDIFVLVKQHRAPTFLTLTGHEQVRSIRGDRKATERLELALPETGACSRATAPDAGLCCGGPAPAAVDACCVTDANAKQQGKTGCDALEPGTQGDSIKLEGRSIVVAMCLGQLGSLLPHVVVPAILAGFLIPEWRLTGAQAGLLAGAGPAGYMCAVPVLATLTDRIDARKILIAGSAVSALGTLLFGLLAEGLWSGALFNAIAGIGFAGAYMPGLKALTDRLAPGDSSRAITLYTSSFSFGVGLSFLVSQLAAEGWGWRSAFVLTALGPLVMLLVCLLLRPVEPKPAQGRLLNFAPVVRNTQAMGFVLGYGAHCFELYGIRTWLVAFWTFVAVKSGQASIFTPIVVSVLFSLLAMPASILGNELALRFGRHRAISAVMFGSAAVALLIGLSADKSPWLLLPLLLVYAITVPADSGALTSGMTMAANPAYRGATMAAHSTVGFSLSALGAWGVGIALDLAGGPMSATAWTVAFSVLALGILLGPVALYWSRTTAAQT